jgi:AcrR family transcriptional regulator
MPAVPKHRQPITDAAVFLFRRNGYSATGLNEIVEISGAPKGSLYYYFPQGKASIAAAAVEEAGRRVAATIGKLATECRCTGDLLRAHARLLSGWKVGVPRRMPNHNGSLGASAEGPRCDGGGQKGLCGPHGYLERQTHIRWVLATPGRTARQPIDIGATGRAHPSARRAKRRTD